MGLSRTYFAPPLWGIPQPEKHDCGAATLMGLLAHQFAVQGSPLARNETGDHGKYPPVCSRRVPKDRAGRWKQPALPRWSRVRDDIAGWNVVEDDEEWATDAVGLARALDGFCSDRDEKNPLWTPLTGTVDPDLYDWLWNLKFDDMGKSRGARETVLARCAWQVLNLERPAALAIDTGGGKPHWTILYGVRGYASGSSFTVQSVFLWDPARKLIDQPLGNTERPVCGQWTTPGYWQHQVMAVCCHQGSVDGAVEQLPFPEVNLQPAARASFEPVRRRILPGDLDLATCPSEYTHLYDPDSWFEAIREHAASNPLVRDRIWRGLHKGRLEIPRPLPVWHERDGRYFFLLPLVRTDRSPESSDWLHSVALADSGGRISHLRPPRPYREMIPTLGLDRPDGPRVRLPGVGEVLEWLRPLKDVFLVWPDRDPRVPTVMPTLIDRENPDTALSFDAGGYPVHFDD